MDKPRISVIVPCYNVEKYLPKCVDSILSQSYHNLEIFLVDDGSLDRSGEIADNYSKQDARIKVVHKKNGGLSDARNVAIDMATGEYVTFVDSDDYIAENYIEVLYKLISKYNCRIAVVNPIAINEKGIKSHIFKVDGKEYCWEVEDAVRIMFYQKMFDTSAWGKLYHRSLFDSGIRYPSKILFEDLPTTYRLFFEGDKVAFGNKELYYYLVRTDSIENAKFNQNKLDSAVYIVQSLENSLGENVFLKDALASRITNFCFHILLRKPKDSDDCMLEAKLKKYRLQTILDHNARMKTRIAAVLSYVGIANVKRLFSLINQIKKKRGLAVIGN